MSKMVDRTCLAFLTIASLNGCINEHPSSQSDAGGLHSATGGAQLLVKESVVKSSQTSTSGQPVSGVGRVLVISEEQANTANIRTSISGIGSLDGSSIELSSTIETAANSTGIVYSPANGVVTRVLVDVGDRVRVGQLLAYVNSPDISDAQALYLEALAKLSQSKAQLAAVRARLELSKANERRVTQLNEEGIAAKKDIENARSSRVAVQSEEAAAIGSMNAALAFLQAARVKIRALGLKEPDAPFSDIEGSSASSQSPDVVTSELPIRAPVSGVVVRKDVFAGQSVGPSSTVNSSSQGRASALMTIANLNKVWVMLEVPQREVSHIHLGSVIDFHSESLPNRFFKGKITRLAESFDPQSRTAHVRAEIDNPGDLLKPGMLVIATLSRSGGSHQCLSIPSSAVQTIDENDVVFVEIRPHQYQVRAVTTGNRTGETVEITSGLRPAERIVTSGAFYLKSESLRSRISGGSSGE